MDFVLLPRANSADLGSETERLKSSRELLLSLVDVGETIRVFAYLPDGTIDEHSRVIRFLIECSRDLGTSASLIIASSLLRGEVLKHPFLPAVQRVIFDVDSGEELSERHVRALEAYSHKASGHQQQVTVWIDGEPDSTRPNLLAGYFRLASTDTDVALRELQLGASRDEPRGDVYAPEDLAAALPRCQLFENTLTVGPDGRVLACPRHEDTQERPDLGGLLTDSLESLLLKKGQISNSLGTLERCRTCCLTSRLLWPESRGEYAQELIGAGAAGELESSADGSLDWILATGQDVAALGDQAFQRLLREFRIRLEEWSRGAAIEEADTSPQPMLSIETPVIKAGWLLPCIESVFRQNSSRWQFSLLWDNGDERSRQILEVLQEFRHPRVSVYYGNGLGIARARRFLTEQTTAEYILPLDDDDLLKPDAVERFLDAAEAAPWSGIIRARRDFVDESGGAVEMEDWFPFGPRRYQRGMTCDFYNHGQPYMISRWAYGQTTGWEGFEEYRFAGEDCDIFAKIEEVAEIELLDGVLYSYRLSDSRTSHQLGTPAAEDMWRRLAIATLQRRAIPLSLESDTQPFSFSTAGRPPAQKDDVDLVILANAWPDAENQSHEPIERWSSKTAVPRDAIHVLASSHCGSQDIAQALVSSNRHYVCLMRGEPGADSADVIAALVRTLQAYDADLIGPKAVDSRGRLLVADPHFTSDLMPATGGPVEADDGRFGYVATVPWLPANLLVVRRHVLRSIPGLDASLAGRLQDADFCLRARRRGFTCLYAGTVTAVCTSFEEEERRVDLTRRFLDRWGRLPHLLFPEERATEARF